MSVLIIAGVFLASFFAGAVAFWVGAVSSLATTLAVGLLTRMTDRQE